MGKDAGEKNDDVLDLSLKKSVVAAHSSLHSVLHSACQLRVSSSSVLPSSAVVTAMSLPVRDGRQFEDGDGGMQLSVDTSIDSSSAEEITGQVTYTSSLAVELFSRCSVATITSEFPTHFNALLTYSCDRYATATNTVSTATTPQTVMSTFTGSKTPSIATQSALKRARHHSGHSSGVDELLADSSSSSSIDTCHRLPVTLSERCSSEPERPQTADDMDDDAYVERRRKNNEAAKRSRDARRLKEKQTALRAAALQQENVQLRAEIAVLRNQAAKLHCLLYNKLDI